MVENVKYIFFFFGVFDFLVVVLKIFGVKDIEIEFDNLGLGIGFLRSFVFLF